MFGLFVNQTQNRLRRRVVVWCDQTNATWKWKPFEL